MNNCRDSASEPQWVRSGAASLSAADVLENVSALPKRDLCLTCLSKESMPFVKSKPPLLLYQKLEVPESAAPSTSSALWLHHAHPYVAAAEKRLWSLEQQRVWSRSCDSKILIASY